MKRLTSAERHLLRLIRRDAREDGWTVISAHLQFVIESLPPELVELRADDQLARLTAAGNAVVDWS